MPPSRSPSPRRLTSPAPPRENARLLLRPDAEDDPFPSVLKVDRLYEDEKVFVVPLPPLTGEEREEEPHAAALPPVSDDELPDPPARPLAAAPDRYLDEPAVHDGLRSADSRVSEAFLKQHKTTLVRPWDGVDLAPDLR